ncbi:putative NTPase/RNA helicase, partial [Listeria ivanovii FSL F6-596]
TFFIPKNAKAISITAIGINIRNKTLQSYESTIQPDKVGPIAGAKAITKPISPIAAPRFSRGKINKKIVCKSGIIIPAPAA